MNERKLFPEKKVSKKRLLEFFDKKGFYIVLILCIAIVGVTAVILSTSNITSSGKDTDTKIIPDATDKSKVPVAENKVDVPKTGESSIALPGVVPDNKTAVANNVPEAAANGTNTAINNDKKSEKPKDNKTQSNVKKPAAKKSSPVSQKFIMPVFGEITFEYAQDKLVYSKTLEEWRTHSGVDLAADRGSQVKAVADGVVSEIKNDPRFGVTIIVDHQNGIKTIYSNLASDEMVTTNQNVKQGDVIGAVGNTASFESAEQSHLHFEVLKNNKPVNPATYLPKK